MVSKDERDTEESPGNSIKNVLYAIYFVVHPHNLLHLYYEPLLCFMII